MNPVSRANPSDMAVRVQKACRVVVSSLASVRSASDIFSHSAIALTENDEDAYYQIWNSVQDALSDLYKQLPLLRKSAAKLTAGMSEKFKEHFREKYIEIFDQIMSSFEDKTKNIAKQSLKPMFCFLVREALINCDDEKVLNHILQYYASQCHDALFEIDESDKGQQPFMHAVTLGKNMTIEKLVELGVDIKVLSKKDKHNAVQVACIAQKPATIRLLLEKYQFDVDSSESEDCQPIFLAAAREMAAESMQVLLSHNPDIYRQVGRDGMTIMHYCCVYSRPEAVRLLCQKDDALRARGEGTTRRLVNTPDYHNTMPLEYVTRSADPTIVKILIEYGADIYCLDPCRSNLLHYWLEEENVELVSLICQKDLDYSQHSGHSRPRLANMYDNTGYTPCQRLLVKLSEIHPDNVESIASIEAMLEVFLVEGGADLSLRPCPAINEHHPNLRVKDDVVSRTLSGFTNFSLIHYTQNNSPPISDMQNALVSRTLSRVADRIEARHDAAYKIFTLVCTLVDMQARRFEMQALRAALQLCQFVSNVSEGLAASVEHLRQVRDSAQ